MSTIRVIISSDFLPEKVLYMDSNIKFIDLSKKVINSVKTNNNVLNNFLGKFLSCLYKIDNFGNNLLLKFINYNDISRNVTSSIKDLSEDGKLYCYLEEVSIFQIDEYEKRIKDEKTGIRNFVDVPLFTEDDNLISSSTNNNEDLLSNEACIFRSQPKSLRSGRFFSWGVKKKKIKGHYYSWNKLSI